MSQQIVCYYCHAELKKDKESKLYWCPHCHPEKGKLSKRNPFLNNQILCLPVLEFIEAYPHITDTKRMRIFEKIGYDCVECGLIGSHLVWWQEFPNKHGKEGQKHIDVAGYNKDNKLIMITIDHIHPRSRGGANSVSNYQPMCAPCNVKKSDKMPPIIDTDQHDLNERIRRLRMHQ